MRALIVDDERLARKELISMLKKHPEIDIVGEAKDANDAEKKITELVPELIFLDIQMPGRNGFELLEDLDDMPQVIFVTAYDEHAIKAFEYSAIDYLLKPVEAERLSKAIEKTLENQPEDTPESNLSLDEKVFIKDGEKCWFVKLGEVSVFESVGNYTRVYFNNEKPLIRRSLNQLEQRLPESDFFRASRQFIINLAHIVNIDTAVNGNLEVLLPNDISVELSRRQSSAFRERMSL